MIKCLGKDVQARLRSGVTINSLGQCVEELVLNSIDAKATCVAIRVDLEDFKVQVVDNGSGMGREDLNAVGRRYFTSRCHSVGDLENLTFYGFRGEAVASIANMASIVEIASKTSRTAKTFVKLFHNGQALEVCEPQLSRPSVGTTVTVCNLFHQLPVRKKCIEPTLEFERVRQKVEAVSLMHPSVSLSLRNDVSCSMVLQLPKTSDVCSRFCQMYGLGRAQKLRQIRHRSGGFELSGYISTEGHYNKNMQFLYVNRRLVLKTRVHKLIDCLLRKDSVICKAKTSPVSRQDSSSPGRHHCSPELHGVFVLNVTCAYSEYDVCLEPTKTLIEFQNWDVLLTCVEEGVTKFLKQEHLFVESCGENIGEGNVEKDLNTLATKPSISDKRSIRESFKKACTQIADSYEMCSLQSKNVKRKPASGKKSSSPVESNTSLQETAMAPQQNIPESSDLCRNNEVEIALPSKDDAASDRIIRGISEQEPKSANSPPKVSDTFLKPSENLSSSFSGGARSGIQERGCCGDLQHCAEGHMEEVRSQQGKAAQESSVVRVLSHVTQLLSEREAGTATGPHTVSGRSLMTLCKARPGDQGAAKAIDDAGGRAGGSVPLRPCSAGLITHITQSEPPRECGQTETSLALNTQHRPGPVGAKRSFVHPVDELLKINAKGLPKSADKECTVPSAEGVIMTGSNEQLENKAVSSEASGKIAVPFATSKRHHETLTVKGLLPAAASGDPQKKGVERRQIAVPRPQPSKKLSLTTQLGSLEKFRRHYGRIKRMLSTAALEQSDLGHLVDSQVSCDSSKNENNNPANLIACKVPAVEDTESSYSNHVLGCLDESLSCSGEATTDKQAPCRSPLVLSGYSQVGKKHPSCERSPGLLSSKLSRMKSDCKVAEQLGEQFQTDSSGRDDCSVDLEPSRNDVVDSACQTRESRLEKTSEFMDSLSKGDVCWQPDSVRAEPVTSTASPSQPSSMEGEHTVSSSNVLSSAKNDDICEDKSTLGDSSEQDVKDTEVPCVTFPSSWDFSADNVSTGDPGNDLCSAWLRVFDVSLGKTVHINKATGLSTYSTPPAERFQAACVEDMTTMAVNVVSERGFQFRCHPFRSEILLPFLPRLQKEKTLASQYVRDTEGESLQSLLSEWENPVFISCPEIAVNVTSSGADSLAVKIHNILYPCRFTKDMVHSMQVLQQVDNKFIACLINTQNEMQKKADGNLLILVDQHAAHERIRLEQLLADSYEKEAAAHGKKKLLSSSISPPLEIEVTKEQRRFLRCCYKSLEDLGLELSFPETSSSLVLVKKVPLCFLEREANELRRKRPPVRKCIVEELLQEQVELVQTTGGGARGMLPLTFLKVLASQACHGAVKFNEPLTLEESCRLIEALSSCQLPFQCAHGRPSMLPLADIDHLQQEKQLKPNLARLRKMAKAWHLFGKK